MDNQPGSSRRIPFLDLVALHCEIEGELAAALDAVIDSGTFVGGPAVETFEHAWATFCGRRHAIGVGNGTDAILLTLRALGVGRGDEVIVPTNTFVASVEAIVAAGAVPRFVDVDPATLLLTAAGVRDGLTPCTAAVLVVHLFGQVADMDAIGSVAEGAGIAVVEDAAQAHGATWRGRPAGSFGAAGCFSFYPGKNLGALGDGGAVVTDDDALAATVRCLADHGRSPTSRHHHERVGTNSRLDAMQAATLGVKLSHLPRWNERRRAIAARYDDALTESGCRPVRVLDEAESARHLYVIRTPRRDEVAAHLDARGIATGIHYRVPCHRHDPYAVFADAPLPVAEAAADEILSLPIGPTLGNVEVDRVVHELARFADLPVDRMTPP